MDKNKKKSKGKSSSAQLVKNKKQRVNAVPANAKAEYVPDNFDSSRLIDIRSDVCAMCKEGHDYGLLLKRIMPQFLDMDEQQQSLFAQEEEDDSATFSKETQPAFLDPLHVWASKYSLSSNRRVFVHLYCAFTSPLVWYNSVNWHNLMREVTRSAGLSCSACKKRGASIGCHDPRCSIVLHLHCALQNGYRQSRFSSTFLCPLHVVKGDSREEESDISRGQEPIPIQIRDFLNNRTPKLRPHPFGASNPYYYITANADSDEVVGNGRNVDDLMSCECTDLCDVVENCRCIRNTGRNYTYLGTLMPGQVANHRIMECNLRCSCSYRRCTNRVVEKGLTFRLEVFRQQKPSKHHTNDGKEYSMEWGVRTLEAIPKDAFVCQLNGQFIKVDKTSETTLLPWIFSIDDWQSDSPTTGSYSVKEMNEMKESGESVPLEEKIVCVDCSEYGNIAAFMKRRPDGQPTMFTKRVVYNSTKAEALPKLALFAAVPIEAFTELVL